LAQVVGTHKIKMRGKIKISKGGKSQSLKKKKKFRTVDHHYSLKERPGP